ncbi:GDP/GTP exchange factor Sec2p [Phlyctema vagabunda]|uniref:GDP/GTP exchange factor Sec2p n=1 Tax=Phlyctema vagabunda TaxID=108571 RepID=A0ABR4PAE6_9HELO
MSFQVVQRQSLQHLRSLSSSISPSDPISPQRPRRPVSKSVSASALNSMAAVATAPGIPMPKHLSSYSEEDGSMSTIPDPRSRTATPANEFGPPSPPQHPDLSNEVATLSNKLINAINHTTNLDDTLSEARHELETSRERVKQLEAQNAEHKELVARGILVRKSVTDIEKVRLQVSLSEEKRQRAEVEKGKKAIELELENLTTALFEEANKMVITAREEAQKEHDILKRKNEQLKTQLADMESLLKSHQDQLAELKQVMEQMTEDRDDQTNATAPSTPGLSKFDSKDESTDVTTDQSSMPELTSPSYPTSFAHLLQPVLRTDLSAYEDFTSLLRLSKHAASGSRASSGSYGSIGLGIGLGGYVGNTVGSQGPSNGSSSSISTAGTFPSSPATPTTPASAVSAASNNGLALTPLKETKFYKRALAEDIEPTLRLDTAPGLSWLARRTVLNSMCDGTLVVEPMPSSAKLYTFPCSLCGEIRKDVAHSRTHRFRTSENENAQRYPLCKYCLGRVRSSCDFLGFLRIVKDGHWRTDGEEAEHAAWEESVKLREQMFWCRVGGGVVPVSHHHSTNEQLKSPRVSEDARKEQELKLSEELERTGEIKPRDITPVDVTLAASSQTPHQPSIQGDADVDSSLPPVEEVAPIRDISVKDDLPPVEELAPTTDVSAKDDLSTEEDSKPINLAPSAGSPQATSPAGGEKDEIKRLSINIPGAFA